MVVRLLQFGGYTLQDLGMTRFGHSARCVSRKTTRSAGFSFVFGDHVGHRLCTKRVKHRYNGGSASPSFIRDVSGQLKGRYFQRDVSQVLNVHKVNTRSGRAITTGLNRLIRVHLFSIREKVVGFGVAYVRRDSCQHASVGATKVQGKVACVRRARPREATSRFVTYFCCVRVMLSSFLFLRLTFGRTTNRPHHVSQDKGVARWVDRQASVIFISIDGRGNLSLIPIFGRMARIESGSVCPQRYFVEGDRSHVCCSGFITMARCDRILPSFPRTSRKGSLWSKFYRSWPPVRL